MRHAGFHPTNRHLPPPFATAQMRRRACLAGTARRPSGHWRWSARRPPKPHGTAFPPPASLSGVRQATPTAPGAGNRPARNPCESPPGVSVPARHPWPGRAIRSADNTSRCPAARLQSIVGSAPDLRPSVPEPGHFAVATRSTPRDQAAADGACRHRGRRLRTPGW